MSLPEITRKVVSYCDIPSEIAKDSYMLSEATCGTYVPCGIPIDYKEYHLSELDNWLIATYPELIGTRFLIEMDY